MTTITDRDITQKYEKGYSELTCKQISNVVEYMTQKHSKALFVRLDATNANNAKSIMGRKHITRVLENMKRTLERKFQDSKNKLDLQYVWTTEQTSPNVNTHYHLFFAVNGNAMQNGYALMSALMPHVQRVQQTNNAGVVHFSESNGALGVMCERNKEDFVVQKAKALENGKYLAKLYSKELNPKWARFSSASRLPRPVGEQANQDNNSDEI